MHKPSPGSGLVCLTGSKEARVAGAGSWAEMGVQSDGEQPGQGLWKVLGWL